MPSKPGCRFVALAVVLLVAGAGCSHQRPAALPASASMQSEGKTKAAWTADMTGTVYVYDRTGKQVLYRNPVGSGSLVSVDADSDEITIGGGVVKKTTLDRDHRYEIWFTPTLAP